MAVPLLDLKRQNANLRSELDRAFGRVMDSCHFILGSELDAFEKECAAYLGVRHAVGVSSGTDAILLALMALGLEPGDEVLCPSFTFFATAGCVARLGAKPVFVDSEEHSFNIDVEDAIRKTTSQTKAIIPVHLFGQAADMDRITAFAKERKIAVVEDAAQAFGAQFGGVKVGGIGEFGCYSFFPSKNLGGFGDAGLLVTQNDELAAKAKILRVHGSNPKYYHALIGGNFRMDALQAALLRAKLPQIDSYSKKRAENAAFYQKAFAGLPVLLPAHLPGRSHIWNQFTIGVKDGKRDALKDHLLSKAIGCEIYYPLPLHEQKCFLGTVPALCPVASQLSREVLSLPIFPELTGGELEEVVCAVRSFFE